MARRSSAYAVIIACASSTALLSPAAAETRGVIELFTSQGCSSCPAADKLVGELATDPTLVAVTLPIDYWDYLGWRDTLADPRNSARQKAYAKVRGDRSVYTPQAVVNGSVHALGSDKIAIERAILKSGKKSASMALPVSLSVADRRLVVTVPGRSDLSPGAEIWFWGLSKAITVAIKRGENKGKTVTYHNVVRRSMKLDVWNGKANTWTVPIGEFDGEGIDRAAVVVQTGAMERPSAILGAAIAAIR